MGNSFSLPAGEPALRVLIFHPINGIWVYLLAAAVLLSLGVYTWRYRQAPAAMCLALSTFARVVWLVALVMITVSPALADKGLWAVIQQLSGLLTIPLALMTALHLTDQRPAVIRAVRIFFIVFIAFFFLAVLTSGWHDWYWRSLPGNGSVFGFARGPLHLAVLVMGYLTLAATLALYLRQAARISGLRRWQALAIPADMLVSMAGHVRWLASPQDPIPVLPVAFMLGSLVWFAIFFGLRVFNLQELAEATVMRDMNDCLIVTDAQDFIIELNPAAEQLFGQRAAAMVGSRAATAFAPWPALASLAESREAQRGEIALAGGHYLSRLSLLSGWGGSIGKAIVLQDIGELKRAQARILEQEKALSIMAERERLGRELHDGPGQVWSYLGLRLRTVETLLAEDRPDTARQELERLISTVGELNADARESIVGLKLAGDTGDDFLGKLRDYLAWYRDSTGLAVELSLPDGPAVAMTGLQEVQLLRIIQEALTNIRKHAGASRVTVGLGGAGGRNVVWVEDDGCGFDVAATPEAKASFGLKIMAERAEEAGGRLAIESTVGGGTRVTVSFDRENGQNRGHSDADTVGR